MPKALDLTGQKFGKLTALKKVPSRNKKTYWLCECECGTQKEIQTSHLTSGFIKSCGCLCLIETKTREKFEYCLHCGNKLGRHQYKFCSKECFYEYKKSENIRLWQEGELSGVKGKGTSDFIRNYMLKKANYKCEKCGWGEKNPYSSLIPLELHHKDGDYTNNQEDNLEILCPNCHSLTENYKSLNPNSTR